MPPLRAGARRGAPTPRRARPARGEIDGLAGAWEPPDGWLDESPKEYEPGCSPDLGPAHREGWMVEREVQLGSRPDQTNIGEMDAGHEARQRHRHGKGKLRIRGTEHEL